MALSGFHDSRTALPFAGALDGCHSNSVTINMPNGEKAAYKHKYNYNE